MTTKGQSTPFHLSLTHAGWKGLVLLDQLRCVDQVRLVKKLGMVFEKTLLATLAILREVCLQSDLQFIYASICIEPTLPGSRLVNVFYFLRIKDILVTL